MRRAVAAFALTTTFVVLSATGAMAQQNNTAVAKAGLFQADDFPAGWLATPHKKSSDPFKCPVIERAASRVRRNKVASANSDDFQHGSVEQFGSSVGVYRTEDVARRAYSLANSSAFRRCLSKLLTDRIKSGAQQQGFNANVEVGSVTGSGAYGDESSQVQAKITLTKGISVDLFASFAFVRVGRSFALYDHISDTQDSTCSQSSSTDCVSFDNLITTATNRLASAASTGGP